MAVSVFGNSYGAVSAGASGNVTGGKDIASLLQNQLAELAKTRGLRRKQADAPAPASAGIGQLGGIFG